MGIEVCAERACRELVATSPVRPPESTPRAAAGAGDVLTAEETQVARPARDVLLNPEIGAGCSSAPDGPGSLAQRY